MASVQSTNLYIFEAYCSKCRKLREVHVHQDIVGSKEFDTVECLCGNKLSVNVLKYLFRTKGYIEDRLKYFVS